MNSLGIKKYFYLHSQVRFHEWVTIETIAGWECFKHAGRQDSGSAGGKTGKLHKLKQAKINTAS